jgi:hypothetical protein
MAERAAANLNQREHLALIQPVFFAEAGGDRDGAFTADLKGGHNFLQKSGISEFLEFYHRLIVGVGL